MTSQDGTDAGWKRFTAITTGVAWFAGVAGVLSIIYAIWWRLHLPTPAPASRFSYIVVGCWTLLPPLWFWWHWYFFPAAKVGDKDWESTTHGHEVSRNLWLALVVVLAALFDLKWPGS